jgi:hypothetical protein
MVKLFTAMVAILTIIPLAHAQTKTQDAAASKEGVNWEERIIIATGIGAPNPNVSLAQARPGALRAAKMIALRNALELAKGIAINSSTTVQDFMSTSDSVTTEVNGFVKGFQQKGKERYMSDGSVEITMEIPLDGVGGMTELLLGKTLSTELPSAPSGGVQEGTESAFSGLIIDCKGLNLKPALSPRVIDEDGKELYGSANVLKDWAVKYGTVGYAKSVQNAAKLERVGQNPTRIKALKASGQNVTDVVISNDEAAKIRKAAKLLKFLSECRVVFVVD